MQQIILLIEDNLEMAILVQRSLSGVLVIVAKTLSEAVLALSVQNFDLILLDINLPDGDGLEFFKTLKTFAPVIILSANSSPDTKSSAFGAGVEDNITKPFCRIDLQARVSRRLHVNKPNAGSGSLLNLGELAIDKDLQRALVNGGAIELTSIEFKILMILANNANSAVNRGLIFSTVWPDGDANTRAIDTHVSKLRKKIGAKFIESVHGLGYRLAV